jgi:hypothetical protein
MLPATDDDEEVDNDINDNNLNIDHDDAKIDKNVDIDNLDANHNDDEPLRFHNINDILGTTWFAPRAQVAEELHMVRLNELTSFIEAEHISRWRKVMMEEMTSIDYDEVFPPVARLDSMCLLITLAAHEGWEVHHMDDKSIFLDDDLQEEVYIEQPMGFIVPGKEDKVLKLRNALYGLHQAPQAWNTKLDDTLLSLGFWRTPLEHAIYNRRNDNV